MKTTQRKGLLWWTTILTAVDITTGEVINGIPTSIKQRYKILRKTKETKYTKTGSGEIHITWECIPKPVQTKLNI